MMHSRNCLRNYARGGLASLLKKAEAALADLYTKPHQHQASAPFIGRCSHSNSSSGDRFAGQVVVVTGGASGIGEATARLFVANGANVVIADIARNKGTKLSEELGPQAEFIYCDVTKEEDIASTVDKAVARNGKLDVYFSNAGLLGALGSIAELNVDEYDQTVAVNLRGAVIGIKHAARVMKPLKKGSIVCTGSVASELAGLGPHSYCISKTALKGLVRSTALELRSFGIRVNMVSPDGVPTPLVARSLQDIVGAPLSLDETRAIHSQRALLPDRPLEEVDIGNAVLFVASDEAGYISGHNLVVDAARTVAIPPQGFERWFSGYAPMLK